MIDPIEDAARIAGAPYGMSAEQVLYVQAVGEQRHPAAPSEQCGIVDPRDDRKWCAEDQGHDGPHNNFRADDTVESYRARFGLPRNDETAPVQPEG